MAWVGEGSALRGNAGYGKAGTMQNLPNNLPAWQHGSESEGSAAGQGTPCHEARPPAPRNTFLFCGRPWLLPSQGMCIKGKKLRSLHPHTASLPVASETFFTSLRCLSNVLKESRIVIPHTTRPESSVLPAAQDKDAKSDQPVAACEQTGPL